MMRPRQFLFIFLCNLTSIVCAVNSSTSSQTTESRLMKELLKSYNPTLRPVYNASRAMHIGVNAELGIIICTDEATESIMFVAYVGMYWTDELLRWNPDEYDGIDEILIPINRIWYPDVGSHNVIKMEQLVPNDINLAKINNQGHVTMYQDQVITMHCSFYVVYFPFDVQNCTIKFASWMQTERRILLFNKHFPSTTYTNNSEWDLISFNSRNGKAVDAGKSTDFVDVIFYDIVIQRKPAFYLTTFMLPSVIITTLAIVGIFSPFSDGGHREEKVTMGLTTLLTMAVILLLITDQMPASSDGIPLLGQFMLVQIGLSALASLTAVLLLYQNRKWINGTTVPHWLLAVTLLTSTYNDEFVQLFSSSLKFFLQQNFQIPEEIVDIKGMVKSLKVGVNGEKFHEVFEGLMEIVHQFMKIVLQKERHDHYRHMWGRVVGRLDILMMIIFLFLNIASTAIFLLVGYSCLIV